MWTKRCRTASDLHPTTAFDVPDSTHKAQPLDTVMPVMYRHYSRMTIVAGEKDQGCPELPKSSDCMDYDNQHVIAYI